MERGGREAIFTSLMLVLEAVCPSAVYMGNRERHFGSGIAPVRADVSALELPLKEVRKTTILQLKLVFVNALLNLKNIIFNETISTV